MSEMNDSKDGVIWLAIWGILFMASGNGSWCSTLSPGKSSLEATLQSLAVLNTVYSYPRLVPLYEWEGNKVKHIKTFFHFLWKFRAPYKHLTSRDKWHVYISRCYYICIYIIYTLAKLRIFHRIRKGIPLPPKKAKPHDDSLHNSFIILH